MLRQLVQLGEQFNILLPCAKQHQRRSLMGKIPSHLAPIVIKEIKQSQELVLAGREAEITTTEKLQALSTRTCSQQQNNS